jgi:hypothetical protein
VHRLLLASTLVAANAAPTTADASIDWRFPSAHPAYTFFQNTPHWPHGRIPYYDATRNDARA